MPSRRGPAAVLALGAATLVLLAGTAPAVADDPDPTPTAEPTPEPAPEPTPEAEPEPAPQSRPEATTAPTTAPAAARPAGLAVSPETTVTSVVEPAQLTVWSVDQSGTRLRDVTAEADYELVGGGGTCAAGTCTSTRAGYAVVKARWDRFSAVAGLQVMPGPAAGIGLTPTAATVGTGDEQVFSAQLVDRYGNATELADDVDFSASDGLDCQPSTSIARCAASTPGTYTVTVALRSDPATTATATLTVRAGSEVLSGLDLAGPSGPVVAGEPFSVTATAHTGAGGSLDVTGRTVVRAAPVDEDGLPDLGAAVTCPSGTCTLDRTGRYALTAVLDDPVLSAATSVEVVAAAPTGLVVTPTEAAVTAGSDQDFRAALVDRFGNRTPAPDAAYAIGAPGTCSGSACTAAVPGTYTVTATDAGRTATATLRVHPDTRPTEDIARIEVAPTTPTTMAGAPATFVVRAYAADGRPLGTVTDDATLAIEGAGTWRTPYGERSLSCTGDTCTATAAGRHQVTAHLGDLTATTTLVVVHDGTYAASGLAPTTSVIRAGRTQAFMPGIVDTYGNLVEPSSGVLALELEASAGATCTGAVCGSTTAGIYVIRIMSVNGRVIDEAYRWLYVALLTVVPGPTDHLGVDPATATVPAGESVELTATAYDEHDNVIDDVTDETTFTAAPGATCVAHRCSSTIAATYPITASRDGESAVAHLQVEAGPVDRVTLAPERASIAAGGTHAFTATGFDTYGNEVGDLTAATTFTSTAPGTCTANACGAAEPGELTVTGAYVVPAAPVRERLLTGRFGALLAAPGDTVSGTATLTVTPAGEPGGNPGGEPGGNPGDDPGDDAGGPGAPPATGGAGSPAGALPATGTAVDWRHGLLAVVLLAAGAACLRRARRT